MDKVKKITLPEVLPYLESAQSEKLTLFINPSGQLETFFSYKGKLIEINKEKIKIDIENESVEEVGESIRSQIISGLHYGYYIVFHLGASEYFNLEDFFSYFKWFPKDLFLNANFKNTKYLRKHNLIKEHEDKDHFGNHGAYEVNDKSKFFILTSCELKDLETLLNNNSNLHLENVYVE